MLDLAKYEGKYAITPDGRVWSYLHNRFLARSLTNKGYWQVQLWKDRKGHKVLIHRALAQAYIPNPLNLPEVNHKNATKTDNALTNLEWCTHRQNMEHCFTNNLRKAAVGERASKAKLKEYQVLAIRSRYVRGIGMKLAREYHVDGSVISEIVNRKIWRHI